MFKKTDGRLVIVQIASIVFIIHGVNRIYTGTRIDIIEAVLSGKSLKGITNETIGEVLSSQILFPFYVYLFCILLFGILNRTFHVSLYNTLITSLVIFGLFPLGAIVPGFSTKAFNYGVSFLTSDDEVALYIGGVLLLGVGCGLGALSFFLFKGRTKIRSTEFTDPR